MSVYRRVSPSSVTGTLPGHDWGGEPSSPVTRPVPSPIPDPTRGVPLSCKPLKQDMGIPQTGQEISLYPPPRQHRGYPPT